MDLLLDLLFPHRCPTCDALAGGVPGFCGFCHDLLVPVTAPACPRCGAPSWADGPATECAGCREAPPPFDRAAAAYIFGGPLAEAIARFKAGRVPEFPSVAGPALAAAARRVLQPPPSAPDLAVAVPPDPTRLVRRGFDPGTQLAAAAARRLGLRLRHGLVVSERRPVPQRSLARAERLLALAGAFRVTPRGRAVLPGRRVLLLDDVRTTGATIAACATALLAAGAARVSVATLAMVE